MHADGVQLYRNTCIKNTRLCIDSINDDLLKINNWANANGLCINPSKFDVPDIIIRGNKIYFVK